MKKYPKIEYIKDIIGRDGIVFDKLDGSNVRFQWNRKQGWYKFGTRNNLMDRDYPVLGVGIDIFLNKYGEDLSKVFVDKYKKVESFIVFGEFFGENSFAGSHLDSDKKDVVLFDINGYKKGFLPPEEFIQNFGHLDIPRVIHKGKITDGVIKSVKDNIWNLNEGVIVKGKGDREVWMTKIKTRDWIQKLKEKFNQEDLRSLFSDDLGGF
jgi:hypothetical protein